MCSPTPPKVKPIAETELPPPPPPPPPPEQTPEAPVLGEERTKNKSDSNAAAAKRRGTSSLRIDLSVPAAGQGLNIPN